MNTRGQGRVFQRKGSPFLWIAYYAHGKEQREVARHVRTNEKLEATEKNHHEAERFLKRRLEEIAAEKHGGRPFVGPQQERVTVGELLDGLEQDLRIRDKWPGTAKSSLKPVRERFGPWRAVHLTSEAIGKYIEELRAEGYANATINRRMELLGQAFEVAIRNKQLSQQPFIPHLSEVGNERQGFFETADFEAVCAKLPEYLRDFLIYLRAENSKTREAETMPLEGELAEIIERRRTAAILKSDESEPRFAEYVFHRDGKPIGDFRKAWATACKNAGVSHRLFHDLRRTASRNMIAAGVPQAVAMKITGHRTDSMFRRYAIVNEDQKRDALQQTQEYLSTSKGRKVVRMRGQR